MQLSYHALARAHKPRRLFLRPIVSICSNPVESYGLRARPRLNATKLPAVSNQTPNDYGPTKAQTRWSSLHCNPLLWIRRARFTARLNTRTQPFTSTVSSRDSNQGVLSYLETPGDILPHTRKFLDEQTELSSLGDAPHNTATRMERTTVPDIIVPLNDLARILKSSNGHKVLELILTFDIVSRKKGSDGHDSDYTAISHSFEIEPEHDPEELRKTGILIAERRERVRKVTTRERQQKHLRGGRPKVSFEEVLTGLQNLTPSLPPRETERIVLGSERELLNLHKRISRRYEANLFADYPILDGQMPHMKIIGRLRKIEQLESKLKDTKGLNFMKEKEFKQYSEAHKTSLPSVRLVRKSAASRSPQSVRSPTLWTADDLENYIYEVTRSRVTGFTSKTVRTSDIAEPMLLQLLFHSGVPESAISWSSLHSALTYLVARQETPDVRKFPGKMREIGFPPNVETYNIILRGCARQQNLSAMGKCLNEMEKAGIKANRDTWNALFLIAPTSSERQHVSRMMARKGLTLDHFNSPNYDPYTIYDSFTSFLDEGGTTDAFIAVMSKYYGPSWLNDKAVVYLLDTLALHGRMRECVDVLERLPDRLLREKRWLHRLLDICFHQRNVEFAVWLIVYAGQRQTNPYDHIIVKQLFQIARQSHMYNLCRVAWKYAVLTCEAQYEMRMLIYSSLEKSNEDQSYSPSHPVDLQECWRRTFGLVSCRENLEKSTTGETKPESVYRSEVHSFVFDSPAKPFRNMVIEALFMDMRWKEDNIVENRSLRWKIDHAIDVPTYKHGPTKVKNNMHLLRLNRSLR